MSWKLEVGGWKRNTRTIATLGTSNRVPSVTVGYKIFFAFTSNFQPPTSNSVFHP